MFVKYLGFLINQSPIFRYGVSVAFYTLEYWSLINNLQLKLSYVEFFQGWIAFLHGNHTFFLVLLMKWNQLFYRVWNRFQFYHSQKRG